MLKIKRKSRDSEVERTGRIPVGADLHHRRLRNPSAQYLRRVIRETEALISAAECRPEWGKKRIHALQKMLEAKEGRREAKKPANKKRIAESRRHRQRATRESEGQ